jgi:multiple sugar transport system ATP-binding protein
MANIRIKNLCKTYRGGSDAVNNVNLEIADKEFLVLVGPSGCGKSTTLRMIAGLEEITSGEIWINDRLVNDIPAKDRNIAMVFQNYALYPHMSVFENMAFGLKLRNYPKAEVHKRVSEAAEILGITQYLERRPGELSGGERQRVALGRAIVRKPLVFLFDEPLSNLDAKMRVQMRTEIHKLRMRLQTTFIYVTHDQTEAMTMGDRVAVMRAGALQQLAPPQDLYDRPANLFVAAFMGSPSMNLYEATVVSTAEQLELSLGSQRLGLPAELARARPELAAAGGRQVVVGIRPEDLTPATERDGDQPARGAQLTVDVELVEALGNEQLVHFAIDATTFRDKGEAWVASDTTEAVATRIAGTPMGKGVARVDPRVKVAPGHQIRLIVDLNRLHFFDPQSGAALAVAESPRERVRS